MTTSQSTLSNPRKPRILFVLGALVLIAGVVVLALKLTGGSNKTSVTPAPSPKPKVVPQHGEQRLVTADGVKVTTYEQLPGEVTSSIRRFVVGAVAGHDLADSWNVLAPVFKHGYTPKSWATSGSFPFTPFPVYQFEKSVFVVTKATTKEVLVGVKVAPTPKAAVRDKLRTTQFLIGLIPAKSGNAWLVNYWMPQWGALVPYGGND